MNYELWTDLHEDWWTDGWERAGKQQMYEKIQAQRAEIIIAEVTGVQYKTLKG
jgi:hypothetical protein